MGLFRQKYRTLGIPVWGKNKLHITSKLSRIIDEQIDMHMFFELSNEHE